MHVLQVIFRLLGIGAVIAAMIYVQYRFVRWNWEQRNKDMKADIKTIIDGKK